MHIHGATVFTCYLYMLSWLTSLAPVRIQWLQRWRSRHWPWARTTIDGGAIEHFARQGRFRPTVVYSYSVDGEAYGGVYTEAFTRKFAARDMLKSVRELPPPARYNANNPAESAMDPYRDATLR